MLKKLVSKSAAKRLFDSVLAKNQIFLNGVDGRRLENKREIMNMGRKTELKRKTALKVMFTRGVKTLKENQCLAKQQKSKVLLTKSHEYSPLWRITSPLIPLLLFRSF